MHKIRGILFYMLTLLVLPVSLSAQHWEVGGLIGGSNYIGDLSHHNLYMEETNFAGGLILRYNINPEFSLKGNIYAGHISGSDENASAEEFRIRNLHFRSFLLDIGIQGEYFIFGTGNNIGDYNFAPYVMGGLSLFRFNPKAELDDEWRELQPMGTEGQETTWYQERHKYSLTQISVPLGMGIKHSINRHWHFGVEAGFRLTFTDYLDDVSTTYVEEDILRAQRGEDAIRLSNRTGEIFDERLDLGPSDQRGDPTRHDHYVFAGVTLTYIIYPPDCYTF